VTGIEYLAWRILGEGAKTLEDLAREMDNVEVKKLTKALNSMRTEGYIEFVGGAWRIKTEGVL
jgi:DNA-binding HxlR family transcriptional regulator